MAGSPLRVCVDTVILSIVFEAIHAMGNWNLSSLCCLEYKLQLFQTAKAARKSHVPVYEVRTAEAARESPICLRIIPELGKKGAFEQPVCSSTPIHIPHCHHECIKFGQQKKLFQYSRVLAARSHRLG